MKQVKSKKSSKLIGQEYFLGTTPKKCIFCSFNRSEKSTWYIFPWDTANFRVLRTEWPNPFLTMPSWIFFSQLLLPMNLYQHARNQVFSSFCPRDIVDLKILNSDWPRGLSPISQEPDFSQKLLAFLNLCQHEKKSVNFSNSYLRYSRLWSLKT